MKLILDRKEPLEGDVISFVFEAPKEFVWQPGQYMKVTLPHGSPDDRGTERWFTIAAPPFERHPRITTRIMGDKASSFKQALNALKPGDTLEADMPEGDFVWGDTDRPYVLIAGGIGFTPFHAMLAEFNHRGEMPPITVLYGARDAEPVFHQELAEFSKRFPQLNVHYIVEPDRIDEAVIRQFVDDVTKPYFYVSGPEPMVEAFDKMFETMGVPATSLHQDYFPGYTW